VQSMLRGFSLLVVQFNNHLVCEYNELRKVKHPDK
jgi:hypothetical protein